MLPTRKETLHDLVIPLHPEGEVQIGVDEFQWQFSRSGGPGGQNVNKLATKAQLRWNPRQSALPLDVQLRLVKNSRSYFTSDGEMLIVSQRYRTQLQNMQDCLKKLHELILQAVPPPKIRRATRPTRGSKERRLQTKKHHSERKAARRMKHD